MDKIVDSYLNTSQMDILKNKSKVLEIIYEAYNHKLSDNAKLPPTADEIFKELSYILEQCLKEYAADSKKKNYNPLNKLYKYKSKDFSIVYSPIHSNTDSNLGIKVYFALDKF